jgi:hypothetical protein
VIAPSVLDLYVVVLHDLSSNVTRYIQLDMFTEVKGFVLLLHTGPILDGTLLTTTASIASAYDSVMNIR